ncbi:MAG: acyltransferase [Tannerella sp.]|jgi:peptidoglycan/LPS O-acetylase OafA/YrhL|nr:acyltransferase [Tannerella sp.]
MNRNASLSSKPHYEILDGLRGIAAIVIVVFHLLEAHFLDRFAQPLSHAYLAVDFFFVLSGFVIGYAYDDRWGAMSVWTFLKRRVFRLHPMVIAGTILGVLLFYPGASTLFPLIADTPVWKMLLYALLGILMIPTPPSIDIRGWQEMYTLDAPTWTLFFEYVANILYAVVIRRFSKFWLAVFVGIAGCSTVYLTLTQGDVIGGWTWNGEHLYVGFTRLLFPFFAGLLLYRVKKKSVKIRNAFLWCSLLLLAVLLACPRLGGQERLWMNGLYEAFAIIVLFPLIVFMGSSGEVRGRFAGKLCRLLGDISYPVYIVNYPIVYLYLGWISDTELPLSQSWPVAVAAFVAILILSYLLTRFYDIPVRKWLRKF